MVTAHTGYWTAGFWADLQPSPKLLPSETRPLTSWALNPEVGGPCAYTQQVQLRFAEMNGATSASQHVFPGPITLGPVPGALTPQVPDKGKLHRVVPGPSQALRGCWGRKAGRRRGQTLQGPGTLGTPEIAHTTPAPSGWDLLPTPAEAL